MTLHESAASLVIGLCYLLLLPTAPGVCNDYDKYIRYVLVTLEPAKCQPAKLGSMTCWELKSNSLSLNMCLSQMSDDICWYVLIPGQESLSGCQANALHGDSYFIHRKLPSCPLWLTCWGHVLSSYLAMAPFTSLEAMDMDTALKIWNMMEGYEKLKYRILDNTMNNMEYGVFMEYHR